MILPTSLAAADAACVTSGPVGAPAGSPSHPLPGGRAGGACVALREVPVTAEETQRQLAELAHYLREMAGDVPSVLLHLEEPAEVEAWLRTEESLQADRGADA